MAKDTLAAMTRGDYSYERAPDSPNEDQMAYLVKSEGFSQPTDRFTYLAALVSTVMLETLPGSIQEDIKRAQQLPGPMQTSPGRDYNFAPTRYPGGVCFFFNAPDITALDFKQAAANLSAIRDMFAPKHFKGTDPSRVNIGPVSPEKQRLFDGVTDAIMEFHFPKSGIALQHTETKTPAGLVFSFPRNTYASFIRNPDLLAMMPARQYQPSDPIIV